MIDEISLDYDEFETLLICALRYALERKMYVANDIVNIITQYAHVLEPSAIEVIRNEITSAHQDELHNEIWRKLLADLN